MCKGDHTFPLFCLGDLYYNKYLWRYILIREYKFYFQYHEIKKKIFSPQGDKNSSPQKEVKYEPFSFADGK